MAQSDTYDDDGGAAEDSAHLDTPAEPDELRARTLAALEFDQIRLRVADRTTFFPARQLALEMMPTSDAVEVEELQRETAEGRLLLAETGDVSLQADVDTTTAVTRAALDGILTGSELLAVADSLEVQRRAAAAVNRVRGQTPMLAELAEGIPDLQELRRQIRARIGDRGEVLDDAAPGLRALRNQVRQAYESVTDSLSRIIQSSAGQEALQDQVVSVRGDRLVVQVKSEMRSRVPGIVHDASNTGATLFIEPFATVDLGNSWRELALEEERAVLRVLRDLSSLVGRLADDIRRGNALAAELDFILARARYGAAVRSVSASSRPARASENEAPATRLLSARHPLLGRDAVPISVNIGPGWSVLVVTGPNTGGKTVAMKTLGLLALMHQSGLQVPAEEGTALPVFDGVYADVGDQQSIEQSVSTFSSHMRNVVDILARAGPESLVLLDELGTSTDPEEGSALAKAVLEHLAGKSVSTVVTTHHRNVAAFAEVTEGMTNASVELDPSTLKPTYIVTMGVPGRSYAMSVAADLGLAEEVMERARSLLEPQHLRFEDWLNELQGERQQLQLRLQEAEQAAAQTEGIRRQLREQLDYVVAHREDIVDSVRREVVARYDDAHRRLRRAEAAMSWSAPARDLEETKLDLTEVRRKLDTQRTPEPPPRVAAKPVVVGDVVFVRGLNINGTILALPEQGDEAEVNVGQLRIRVGLSRLTPLDQQPEPEPVSISLSVGPSLGTQELDLRGLRVEEAEARLEDFLDKAIRDGLSTARIIHGRGTGAIRSVVRERLSKHPLARSFEPETPDRGGDGATLVQLA